jgi:hypothetical protein
MFAVKMISEAYWGNIKKRDVTFPAFVLHEKVILMLRPDRNSRG